MTKCVRNRRRPVLTDAFGTGGEEIKKVVLEGPGGRVFKAVTIEAAGSSRYFVSALREISEASSVG